MFKCVFDGFTIENAFARQTSNELDLLSLNRVFHGIRLFATNYIGWPTSRFLSLMIDIARVVQGERRAELARAMLSRSPHSQSISLMLCKDTIFFVRCQILPFDLGRFSARI
jgi:hypothetical protein